MVVEKLITRAKNAVARKDAPAAAVHARREVGRLIKDAGVISELFSSIAEKVATRPGGYTRIVKLGQRQGDGAHLAVIELVDFNTGKEPAEKAAAPEKEKKDKKEKKGTRAKTEKKEKKEPRPKESKKKDAKSGAEGTDAPTAKKKSKEAGKQDSPAESGKPEPR